MFTARRVVQMALVIVAVGVAGCEKKQTNAAPPGAPPPGMPALTGAPTPPSSDKPEHPPTGQLPGHDHAAMPPGHPPMPEGGNIDPEQTTPGNIAFDPKTVISGVLRLDDKVKAKVKEGDVIFLTARQADPAGAPGPIVAVKKLTAAKWPLPFQLDGRDAMMTGTKMAGKVVITVRVDKDGDAITKNPGDVTGVSRALELPSDKVVVTLDTVL
jgi:hypothetical protein